MSTQTTDVNTTTSTTSSEVVTPTTTTGPSTEVTSPATTPISDAIVPVADPDVAPVAEATSTPPVVEDPISEDYDLELADDSPLSQADLDAVAQEASDRGLNLEEANKLIAQREGFYKSGSESVQAANNARLNEDNRKFNLDPEFSGEKRVESFALIKKAADTFGDADLIEALRDPYIGNNLPLAKFLAKVGAAMGNDPIVTGREAFKVDTGLTPEQTRLRNAYPEHFEKK